MLVKNIDKKEVLQKANVPEHSVPFMESMSGGKAFLIDSYLFYHTDNLLMAVGYPLSGTYQSDAFYKALTKALDYTSASDCFAISPFLPRQLRPHQKELCQYFTLPANHQIPSRLERLAERAASTLKVEENTEFTLAHRHLWAEFVGRTPLAANVRRLYERTEKVMTHGSNLILLNAWDEKGNLAASLLLDLNPHKFLSYILGAHSRVHYTP
ncbi:MAG: GNAT family N-acetyltransferase, partial [Clostridia bacterium]|nr:GNAT family N-acetyltransferase [Clostridia bacterium]